MKVATVTMLEKNYNYGATLQAYALAKYLNQQGYECEVLRLVHYVDEIEKSDTLNKKITRKLTRFLSNKKDLRTALWDTCGKIQGKYSKKIVDDADINNQVLFNEFIEKYIPCSELYYKKNICDANKIYDVFICGSDQIWKPECTNGAYFLDFCGPDKGKIAYAPSIARTTLNDKEIEFLKSKLCGFKVKNISLREDQGAKLLEKIIGESVPVVLDPTFLLDRDDWVKLATTRERIIKEKYCLSYFLSPNCKATSHISRRVHQRGLKLASISYGVEKSYYQHKKADYALENIGPIEFLNLILYADIVYTDSFHGVVFSILFNKMFRVLNRKIHGNNKQMSSRFDTLLELAGAKKCKISIRGIEQDIDNETEFFYSNLEKKIDFSRMFLKNCLSDI